MQNLPLLWHYFNNQKDDANVPILFTPFGVADFDGAPLLLIAPAPSNALPGDLATANITMSWTNHVGIIVEVSGKEPLIAENRLPFSGKNSWSRFVKRSDQGGVAITQLPDLLDQMQQSKLKLAADKRVGRF